jgi:hypothetical protein
MEGSNIGVEMPKYKSHKEVWALKIKSIKRDGEGENRESDGSAIITPEDGRYAPFRVDSDYMWKHKPQDGGYYVVYKDGYKSFSPANVFEEGNTLITNSSKVTFGQAIEAAKSGKKVSRSGWNGANMYAYIVPAASYPAQTDVARAEFGDLVPYRAYWALKTAQNDIAMWSPSGSDSLAEDWVILD